MPRFSDSCIQEVQATESQPGETGNAQAESEPEQRGQEEANAQQKNPDVGCGRVELTHSWIQALAAPPSEPSESIGKSEPAKETEKTAEAAQHSRVQTWQRRNHSFLDSGRANSANATIRAIRVHREE